jgi:hypothetical protein
MRPIQLVVALSLCGLLAVLCLAPGAQGQSGQPAPRKNTTPPPKFDKRVLDVFFTNVLEHVGPGRPGSGAAVAGTASAVPATGNSNTAPAAGVPVPGGFTWSKLITGESLEAEIKEVINAMAGAVEAPGRFKSQHYKQARRGFSMLATLFGVVAEYDGDVKWKDKAPGMRDTTGKAAANCKVGTDQSFNDAKGRYEDLRQLLSGGNVQVPEAERAGEFAKVADLSELMKRMEEAGQGHITPWAASQAEFNSNKDKFLQEAQVLAVLSQVIQHTSYEYAADDGYLGHAAHLQKACLEMIEGAKSGNYDKARAGAGEMAKACANCHTDYR